VGAPVLVGLDVGTTSVKGLAVSAQDGSVLATAEAEHPLSTPRPGWAEQDPEDWWRGTEAVLEALTAEVGRLEDVAGIGLSGQMHGLVALGADDEVLRPAILWNDQRTGAQCTEIESRIGRERLVELTGNRALTGFTAPKLLWLRDEEPGLWERIESVLLPKDYVRLRLTGERAIDVADASGTLLLDVGRRRWSTEVLSALEIPEGWLPPLLESPTRAGEHHGIPVAVGAGDQAAGAVGVGVVGSDGPLSVALGTSGVVFAALPEYAGRPRGAGPRLLPRRPGRLARHGRHALRGGVVALAARHDGRGGRLRELVAEAEGWEAGAEGLTFLPYLAGERTPHADPDARGAFAGLSLRHDRGALTRAVLEGVAFGLRDSLDLLRELGVTPERARVSGGGARSPLWLRIVASGLGLPLERTAVDEGAAYGAALLGGVAGGVFASVADAVATCVRVTETVDPDPPLVERYAACCRATGRCTPRCATCLCQPEAMPRPGPRAAVTVVFVLNGLAFGSWAARIPAIKERLGVGEAGLGLVLAGIAVGALAAMPVAGWWSARVGSRFTTQLGWRCCA
jgi:xylulokinase